MALAASTSTSAAFKLASQAMERRHAIAALAPALLIHAPHAIAVEPMRTPPTDFRLLPEGRPYVNYLQNAGQLAAHLKWYSQGVDPVDPGVGAALADEITRFSAIYTPRPGALVDSTGATPGLTELRTAYDALADHFSRAGCDAQAPLPDALAATVRRNAVAAQKLIRKAQQSRGKWPTCGPEGGALGSRDMGCSTMTMVT